jgi:outer membrane receptor for ferrienterochelin and colicin
MNALTYVIVIAVCLGGVVSGRGTAAPAAPGDSSVFTMSLDELASLEVDIASTGFFHTLRTQAPGSHWVISREQLDTTPATMLWEVLQYHVPGVHIGFNQRLGPLVGVRGIMPGVNSKILTMLDGQNLNQRVNIGYMSGFTSPFFGDVEAIEVVKGPGAIVHGSGAINAFVNLVPKNGAAHPGTAVTAEWGATNQLGLLEMGHGWSYGASTRKHAFLYGGIAAADGFQPANRYGFEQAPPAGAPRYPGWEGTDVGGYPKPSYRLAAYWTHERLNTNVVFQEMNHHTNNLEGVDYTHQAFLAVRPRYTLPLGTDDSLDLVGASEWYDNSMHNHWFRPIVNGQLTRFIPERGGSESHAEGKVIWRSTRWPGHALAIGTLRGHRGFRVLDQYFSAPAQVEGESYATSWNEVAGFAEDVWTLSPQVTLSAGARFDDLTYRDIVVYQDAGTAPELTVPLGGSSLQQTSPRLAAAWQCSPVTTLKASYQHGFQTPDVGHFASHRRVEMRVQQSGFPTFQIPMLKPERLESIELGLRRDFDRRQLTVDMNLFHNTYRDQIHFHNFFDDAEGLVPPGAVAAAIGQFGWLGGVMNAAEKFSAIGGEMMVNWTPRESVTGTLSYSYTRPVGMSAENNRSLLLASDDRAHWGKYPGHCVKADLTGFLWDRQLLGSLNAVYEVPVSAARSTQVAPQPPLADPFNSGRTLVNVSLQHPLSPTETVKLMVRNLFKESTPPASFLPSQPWHGLLGQDARLINLEYQRQF